jgi:hypothetical protein
MKERGHSIVKERNKRKGEKNNDRMDKLKGWKISSREMRKNGRKWKKEWAHALKLTTKYRDILYMANEETFHCIFMGFRITFRKLQSF